MSINCFAFYKKKHQFIHKVVIIKHIYFQNSLKQMSFLIVLYISPAFKQEIKKTKQQTDKQTNKWEKTKQTA